MYAGQLVDRLRLDFTAADLGDTATTFRSRLDMVAGDAVARTGTTDAQQEAGARYLLLSAQLRQLVRKVERLKSASGSEIEQGLATRLAEVRRQQAEQLALSGLAPSSTVERPRSQVLQVEVGF